MSRTSPPPEPVLELATRKQVKLRAIISGATGSGKTCTGFRILSALAHRYGGKIGVIDTQNKQSLDYAETEFTPHGFYPIHLQSGRPEGYINALNIFARAGGFCGVLIDSLTDAWAGEDGVLEQAGANGKAEFSDWGPLKKGNNELLRAIQRSPFHIVATVLADTQYLISTEARDGKDKMKSVSVVGTKPIQDKKTMPKFPLQLAMDEYHRMTVVRTSFPPYDRMIVEKPGEDWMIPFMEWMDTGKADMEVEEISRAATLEQLAEYYDLQLARGVTKEVVVPAFFRKYSFRPEDCSEEFMEERLQELRGSVLRPRPGKVTEGKETASVPVVKAADALATKAKPAVSPRFAKPDPNEPTKLEKEFEAALDQTTEQQTKQSEPQQ